MLRCYEDFSSFTHMQNLTGTESNEWTIQYAEYPCTVPYASEERDGVMIGNFPHGYGGVCTYTYNNPNVQSVSNLLMRVKTAWTASPFTFGFVFRYSATTGGLAFYCDGSQMRLISFSTGNPFSSPTVEANLDAFVSHIKDDIWISANGTEVKIYLHGELISTTTVSHVSPGKVGVISKDYWGITDFVIEDFQPALMAPSNLTATAVSSSAIKLEWSNTIPDAGEILIEKKVGSTGSWNQIDTAPGDAVSYIDNDADTNTINYYRVRAASNPTFNETYWKDHFDGTIGTSVSDWIPTDCTFIYGPATSQAIGTSYIIPRYTLSGIPSYDVSLIDVHINSTVIAWNWPSSPPVAAMYEQLLADINASGEPVTATYINSGDHSQGIYVTSNDTTPFTMYLTGEVGNLILSYSPYALESNIQSTPMLYSTVFRRLQIKVDAFEGVDYKILLRNENDDTLELYTGQTEPGSFDVDFAKILWESEEDWRDLAFVVEVWFEGNITIDMVKIYYQNMFVNQDTCYFQDFFEDVDGTLITAHNPDINRVDTKFMDLSGGSWDINSDFLRCLYPPDDGSLTIDTRVRSYKQSVYISITTLVDFDYKFTVDFDKQFHIKNDGLWLMQHDSVIRLYDPNWVPSIGQHLVEIEVHPFFISMTINGTTLKYYKTTTPDTVFGIGTDSSTTPYLSNIIFRQYKEYSDYSNTANVTITTLTIQEIWERYSEIQYERGIYVKRIDESGTYEDDWYNINDLIHFETRMYNVCGNIQYALPNNTYSLGAVTIDNANLSFANQSGQLSNEEAPNSIFRNFIRHKSLIRIVDSFIDQYTYPGSYGKVDNITFEGFIDDRLCVTNTDDTENIIATDVMGTLLKAITIAEMSLTTNQTIQNLIYQVMNRSHFTDFFSVSLTNINPGFDATNIDLTEYDQSATAWELLQELSIGHSIFYVRDGVFYYTSDDPTVSTILELHETPQRKIKFNKFNSGGAAVFDKLYWQGATESWISPTRTYDQVHTFDTKGIDHPTQRQGLLDYAGPRLSQRKITFDLTIPFLPVLFLLDRISVLHRGILQEGCFILDISRLDEGYFLEPVGAFTIAATDSWKIIKLVHSANNQTTMTLEKII